VSLVAGALFPQKEKPDYHAHRYATCLVEEAAGMREDARDRLNPLAQPVRGFFGFVCWADQRRAERTFNLRSVQPLA
jgi:hypothetical protein